jgi:rhomboid protease GluP
VSDETEGQVPANVGGESDDSSAPSPNDVVAGDATDLAAATASPAPSSRRFKRMGEEGLEFVARLYEAQPRAWVVPAIVLINTAIFIIMVATGVSFIEPTADQVLPWGANFGPKTSNGEWWRLISGDYLHFGIMHLAFNMFIFADMGRVVERLFGSASFFVVYTIAGIVGSIGTLMWSPYVVSAGASGAVFGVFGAFFAYIVRQRHTIPGDVIKHLGRDAAILVAINVFYGFGTSGIDNAAHIGGLLGGFAMGLALARPMGQALSMKKSATFGFAALVLAAAICIPLSGRGVDVAEAFQTLETEEAATVDIAQKAGA